MIKIITKSGCTRCVQVKEYMKGNGIEYEEIYVENPADLDVYRQMLIDNNRPLGFPILLQDSKITNGSTEEIIDWLITQKTRPESVFFWGR